MFTFDKSIKILTENVNLKEEIDEEIAEIKDVKITGVAIIADKPTRNNVVYTLHSLNATHKSLIGKPILNGHDDKSYKNCIGHVTNAWMEDNTLMYEASIDPAEEDLIRKIKRGDIPGVSIQVVVDEVDETIIDGEQVIVANVKEFLELSIVLIPGERDSTITLVEAYNKYRNENVKSMIKTTIKPITKPVKIKEARVSNLKCLHCNNLLFFEKLDNNTNQLHCVNCNKIMKENNKLFTKTKFKIIKNSFLKNIQEDYKMVKRKEELPVKKFDDTTVVPQKDLRIAEEETKAVPQDTDENKVKEQIEGEDNDELLSAIMVKLQDIEDRLNNLESKEIPEDPDKFSEELDDEQKKDKLEPEDKDKMIVESDEKEDDKIKENLNSEIKERELNQTDKDIENAGDDLPSTKQPAVGDATGDEHEKKLKITTHQNSKNNFLENVYKEIMKELEDDDKDKTEEFDAKAMDMKVTKGVKVEESEDIDDDENKEKDVFKEYLNKKKIKFL